MTQKNNTQCQNDNIRKTVREQYRKMAVLADFGYDAHTLSCCKPRVLISQDTEILDTLGRSTIDSKQALIPPIYSNIDGNNVVMGTNMGLGCGNPKAIASLKQGEIVLDLGSGGGFDCFLAAQEVGEAGHIIGIDMTSEMISKARTNVEKLGYRNVEFRLGEIENLPVEDATIDVIISNCVINLSPEKTKVFSEAFRVLKSGGRLAISDIVAFTILPEKFKNDMMAYIGCIAGASLIQDIEMMLINAGFVEIQIKPKAESKEFIQNWVPNSKLEEYLISATIEAVKGKT